VLPDQRITASNFFGGYSVFNQFKIGTRMITGFSIGLIIMLIIGITGFIGVKKLGGYIDTIPDVDVALSEHSTMTIIEVLQLRRYKKDSFVNIDAPEKRNDKKTTAGITNVEHAAATIRTIINGVNSISAMMDTIHVNMEKQVNISSEVDNEVYNLKGISNEIRIATES